MLAAVGVALLVPKSWATDDPGLADRSAIRQTGQAGALIQFNIATQPLVDALKSYVDATGYDAIYDTSLVAGRLSAPLHGALSAQDALRTLVTGSGLTVDFVAATTFVLLPAPSDQRGAQKSRSPQSRRYYGLIQARITETLCHLQDARPGRYRFTTVFWIGTDGAVKRSHLIGSSGVSEVDRRISTALESLRFDEAPPAGFLQPVLIAIVPEGPEVVRTCDRT